MFHNRGPFISVPTVMVLLLLPSLITIPAYSQTYDKWFADGWDAGCEDSTTGAQNQTEGMNTPFTKGYILGFAECSPSNAANDTAVTNMTQETDGNKTQVTSTESEYDIGCGDARLNGIERYINQPGNEPSSQTEEFMQEYYRGYYECGGTFPAEEGHQPEPPAEPPSSGTNRSESTSSESLYSLGYNYGCDERTYRTENHPSKSLTDLEGYTDEFIRGYYDGFAGCDSAVPPSSQPSDTQSPTNTQQPPMQRAQPPSTQPPSTQPPMQGGIDWITVCNNLQSALISSCNVLVNPDNTLTTEGERAVGCIRNGIALAGGGTLLASLPLPLVITALKILEEPTGCGGIVEWGAIGNVGDLKGIINLLT